MAALTDATLLWAPNAVDLCYKCDLKYVVHGRGGLQASRHRRTRCAVRALGAKAHRRAPALGRVPLDPAIGRACEAGASTTAAAAGGSRLAPNVARLRAIAEAAASPEA